MIVFFFVEFEIFVVRQFIAERCKVKQRGRGNDIERYRSIDDLRGRSWQCDAIRSQVLVCFSVFLVLHFH